MKHSCSVGATHFDDTPRDPDLPGAAPEFFFAPGQMKKRAQDWGPAEMQRRIGESWSNFRDWSDGWLVVREGTGREALEQVYHDTLEGRTLPSEGHVLSLQDPE